MRNRVDAFCLRRGLNPAGCATIFTRGKRLNEIVTIQMTKEEETQFSSIIQELLVAMRQAKEQMDKDQTEIESIKARTKEKLAELRKVA